MRFESSPRFLIIQFTFRIVCKYRWEMWKFGILWKGIRWGRVEEVSYGNRLVCTSLAFGPSDLCNQVLPSSLVESWKYICLSCSTRWIKIYDNVSKCVRKWKSFVVWKLRKMMEGKFLYSYFERIYYFSQPLIIRWLLKIVIFFLNVWTLSWHENCHSLSLKIFKQFITKISFQTYKLRYPNIYPLRERLG